MTRLVRTVRRSIAALLFAASFLPALAATNHPVLWPGRQPDGSMLLPNQWSLRPAGTQLELGDFPVNLAVHPRGKFAAVLHSGYSQHEIVVVDLIEGRIASRTDVPESFYGLAFSPNGKQILCSGSSGEVVYLFKFADGLLSGRMLLPLRRPKERGVPCGVTWARDGRSVFAANLWNSRATRVNLATRQARDYLLGSGTAPAEPASTSAAEEDSDTAAATKRARALAGIAHDDPDGLFPYACVLDARRDRLFISLWGAASVAVLDLKSGLVTERWATGEHPCELVLRKDGKYLFVANANDNTVTVLETQSGRAVETISVTLYPNAPRGSTPNSLALSPDEELLFVANANINAVGVFEVAQPGRSRALGFIPTGWYPTSVRVTPDGKHLLVTNGKGNVAKANPRGPQPVPGASREEYIGKLFRGTLGIIELPPRKALEARLAAWTTDVLKCSPLRPEALVTGTRPEGSPIPARPGEPSPITHCIYIIKENRTYDQVFGDMPEGNGDASLCLFPERVTPNHHKLARDFVLLDNFYVESEVSADGHEWTMAAYATDFVEKTWPLNYGHGKSGKFPYPSEGVFDIAKPASGYLWDRARAAGVSYRSYGEFVQNAPKTNQPATTRVKSLEGHFDPWFRSFDMTYPDVLRARRFISELQRFEREGDMPRLQIVRLPNDHTHGTTAGRITPTAYVAENDVALGMVVEAVSQSKFWPHTAIFVVEDDAQNGPDHVDAHRTVALVFSPYTKRRAVDSTLYSTSSMLRTMELILGLQPMTQFDAAATPMFNSFQSQPDLTPYVALPANVDLGATNTVGAWGSKIPFNFAKEDAADDLLFNEVIWRSVKGADRPMPAPVRAGFVLTRAREDDDDD
jgi:YVTN family beta-propeller protein